MAETFGKQHSKFALPSVLNPLAVARFHHGRWKCLRGPGFLLADAKEVPSDNFGACTASTAVSGVNSRFSRHGLIYAS